MNPDEIVNLADQQGNKCWFTLIYEYFDNNYKNNSLEERADLYHKAANSYKLNKQNSLAGDNYMKASLYYGYAHCDIKKVYCLVDAFNVYKTSDSDKAIDCLRQVIQIYTDSCNCEKLMEYKFKLAEVLKDAHKYEEAIELYKDVMEVCETIPHCLNYKNKSILNLADIYINLENYANASIHFERYAYDVMKISLLKLQAKEYLFNSILCKFYDESVETIIHTIDRYCNDYPQFDSSRENKLLKGIIDAINKEDEDAFTDNINEYDQISRLKDWQVRVLLKVKDKYFNQNNNVEDDLC